MLKIKAEPHWTGGFKWPCEIAANCCYASSPRTLLLGIVRHTGQLELDIGTY